MDQENKEDNPWVVTIGQRLISKIETSVGGYVVQKLIHCDVCKKLLEDYTFIENTCDRCFFGKFSAYNSTPYKNLIGDI